MYIADFTSTVNGKRYHVVNKNAMHVILSNYRSGSLTFARDYAKDCGVPFLGDPYSSVSPNHELCNDIEQAVRSGHKLPQGVIKLYPHDLAHNVTLVHELCARAETIHIVSKKSFDSIVRSCVIAERLLSVLNIQYSEPFTINHTFVIPKTVYTQHFFMVLQNTVDLIKLYHHYRDRVVLRWYEDMFEIHSRTHRPVTVQTQLPVTDICVEQLFNTFTPTL